MGRIAQTHADHVWVTDDNPRDEDPATIRAAILATCPKGQEIGNRGEAIAHALSLLAPGDTLLVAGKGHEREQIGRERVDFFDDRACVQTILDSLKEENTP
jgi:UDP-N-acetylmuramoyl-L-alanyl-D-glutamate--2,6-diaminopimelate ligase